MYIYIYIYMYIDIHIYIYIGIKEGEMILMVHEHDVQYVWFEILKDRCMYRNHLPIDLPVVLHPGRYR